MGLLDQLNHLLNFLAPALAVGVLLALISPLLGGSKASAGGMLLHSTINFLAGVAALGAGLWYFGRDGKMASYGAMLVCCAISQVLVSRR